VQPEQSVLPDRKVSLVLPVRKEQRVQPDQSVLPVRKVSLVLPEQ
jgi:hypothetical protein